MNKNLLCRYWFFCSHAALSLRCFLFFFKNFLIDNPVIVHVRSIFCLVNEKLLNCRSRLVLL